MQAKLTAALDLLESAASCDGTFFRQRKDQYGRLSHLFVCRAEERAWLCCDVVLRQAACVGVDATYNTNVWAYRYSW